MHSQTIWKYPLLLKTYQTIRIPAGGRILCTGVQHETITLWATVDGEKHRVDRDIYIFGTGRTIKEYENLDYVGTVNMAEDGTEYVWHVFERQTPTY